MSQIVTQSDIKRLGTILVVCAHPDDETFIAGGLLAAAAKNGQRVVCVTATHGEQGVQDEGRWPQARLGDIRTRELQAALKELGITKHHWLTYQDGQCDQANQSEAIQKITAFIKQYQPDSVITFGLDGLTGHPDHQAVSKWVSAAVLQLKSKATIYHAVYDPKQYEQFLAPLDRKVNMFFNIDKPPLVSVANCAVAFVLPDDILQQKLRALGAMPSQMERTLAAMSPDSSRGIFGIEYFTKV